ncbi:Wzz/FepE/Etk N-terminal domain-containing protein [Salinibacter ruber]|uniref:Wzz/FepE/Etk N-terminal domain-containing protein n=1 Tax=Salinibacter ruber TaxID=146919 RepID=UPI000E571289|nr:Wzz/FepE/Etk N-terminal domain-containing protein [Salinibacter ruber]
MSTADDQGQTEGPPETPPGDGAPKSGAGGYGPPREDEVSLLDILLVLARHKTLIMRTVLVFTLLGVTYALLAPEQFTSEARVVREAQEGGGGSGGLPSGIPSGALSSFGINLGGSASGLTPAAFPEILESREVRLAVARDTFRFPDVEQPMTFQEYANRPPGTVDLLLKYTLVLPFTVKDVIGDALSGESGAGKNQVAGTGGRQLTEEEHRAVKAVGGKIASSVDEENGLMTISATAGGPKLASSVAESFLNHFTTRVREIRTQKVQERLDFVEERFEEAEQELETVEERLAQFLERNQNPTTATLQFRRDRLQRQVSFKEQLYSELQSQLTQTRLDLQRRQPVVTVVEEPVAPMLRSAPKRTLITVFAFMLGLVFGMGAALVRSFFLDGADKEEKRKMKGIKTAFENEGMTGRIVDYYQSLRRRAEA